MPKSKNSKSHKDRLAKYKMRKKKEQEILKKKMIDEYMKIQQDAIANKETHTSTQEVSGPEINIDELNKVNELEPINIEGFSNDLEIDVDELNKIEKNDEKI